MERNDSYRIRLDRTGPDWTRLSRIELEWSKWCQNHLALCIGWPKLEITEELFDLILIITNVLTYSMSMAEKKMQLYYKLIQTIPSIRQPYCPTPSPMVVSRLVTMFQPQICQFISSVQFILSQSSSFCLSPVHSGPVLSRAMWSEPLRSNFYTCLLKLQCQFQEAKPLYYKLKSQSNI